MAAKARSAVDPVRYEQCLRDLAVAALSVVLNVVATLNKKNAPEIVQDKDTCAPRTSKLVAKLHPPELPE